MKERPILFSAPMVRAILAGRKTMTRRVVKSDSKIAGVGDVESWARRLAANDCYGRRITDEDIQAKANQLRGRLFPFLSEEGRLFALPCPHGQPGDRLWVREAFSGPHYQSKCSPKNWSDSDPIWYWADGNPEFGDWTGPKPSIHMPRWASRITLEITGVRVDRLNDISEADCIAEGCAGGHRAPNYAYNATPYEHFNRAWELINGAGSWDANPWVWVIEFKRIGDWS